MKEQKEEKNREVIFKVLDKFCNSLQAKNLDDFQSLLHKEIIFIPHDLDLIYGCEQVIQYYQQMLEKLSAFQMNFEEVKIKILDPYAWAAGRWEAEGKIRRQVYDLKGHVRAEEENFAHTRGRFSAIFKKEAGSWLMIHGHSSISIAETCADSIRGNLFFNKS